MLTLRQGQLYVGAMALIAVTLIVGCGGGVAKVNVPNVIGEGAAPAVRSIEHSKLAVILSPQPADRSLCTVSDQDQKGEVPEDTKVTLTLHCLVVIPSVIGQPAGPARAAIRAAGGTVGFVGGGTPKDEVACTIKTQSLQGNQEPNMRVMLDYYCPLTAEDLQANAEGLGKTDQQNNPGDTYSIGECRLTSDRTGECDVNYYTPDGSTCSGVIYETVVNNDQTINSRDDVTCN